MECISRSAGKIGAASWEVMIAIAGLVPASDSNLRGRVQSC